jgi:hypothetical protein
MLGAIYLGQVYPAGFPGIPFEAPPAPREGLPIYDFDSPTWSRAFLTPAWPRSSETVTWARSFGDTAWARTFITPAWARSWRGEE